MIIELMITFEIPVNVVRILNEKLYGFQKLHKIISKLLRVFLLLVTNTTG